MHLRSNDYIYFVFPQLCRMNAGREGLDPINQSGGSYSQRPPRQFSRNSEEIGPPTKRFRSDDGDAGKTASHAVLVLHYTFIS